MNLEHSRLPGKPIVLNNLDVVVATNDSQRGPQRTVFDYFRLVFGDKFQTLIRIREIDVPGVKLPGDIRKQPKLISSISQDFPLMNFIVDRTESSIVKHPDA